MNLPEGLQSSVDKALASFRNLNHKQRNMFFCGILFLLFLMDYFLIMRPQWNALINVKEKLSTLRQDITRTSNDVLELNNYREKIKEINEKILLKKSLITSKDDLVMVFEVISKVADDNNIRVEKMMPKPEDQTSVLLQDGIDYYRLPIAIEGWASYHDFGRFINQLEEDDAFFEVVAFSISNFNQEEKKHFIDLTVATIVYDVAEDKESDE